MADETPPITDQELATIRQSMGSGMVLPSPQQLRETTLRLAAEIERQRGVEKSLRSDLHYNAAELRAQLLKLTAENQRLREERAAMLEVVRAVASINEHRGDWGGGRPYDAQVNLLTITQARAIVGR